MQLILTDKSIFMTKQQLDNHIDEALDDQSTTQMLPAQEKTWKGGYGVIN